MTTRVGPPASDWRPIVQAAAGLNKLTELLDALHEHALVAWDRDVHLTPRELGDDGSPPKEGNITVAVPSRTSAKSEGADILGYAYVDCRQVYRLTRVSEDPLGVRWIDPTNPGKR